MAYSPDCIQLTDGVIIEDMDIQNLGRWMWPPSWQTNWWVWGILFFVGMFGMGLLMSRFFPIHSPAPVIQAAPQYPTPKPGQGIGPNGLPVDKPVGL